MHRALMTLRGAVAVVTAALTLLVFTAPATAVDQAAQATSAGQQISLDIELDDVSEVDPSTGRATLTGTLTCQGEFGEFGPSVFGELEQRAGRMTISGYGFDALSCDNETVPFALEIEGRNGRFAAGPAHAFVDVFACTGDFGDEEFECTSDSDEEDIRLQPSPNN